MKMIAAGGRLGLGEITLPTLTTWGLGSRLQGYMSFLYCSWLHYVCFGQSCLRVLLGVQFARAYLNFLAHGLPLLLPSLTDTDLDRPGNGRVVTPCTIRVWVWMALRISLALVAQVISRWFVEWQVMGVELRSIIILGVVMDTRPGCTRLAHVSVWKTLIEHVRTGG